MSEALTAELILVQERLINGHLKPLNAEGELQLVAINRTFRIVRQDGFLQVSRK